MLRYRSALLGATLLLTVAGPSLALDLRVGTGAGCTHTGLQSALDAIEAQAGSHTIRINKGVYAVPGGMAYQPTVDQIAVFLEGGYDNCASVAPSGDPTLDADRALFDGAGGTQRAVLDLYLFGRVGTLQLRRIVLTGGDATAVSGGSDQFESGGGLAIRGRASALLGIGASIKGNAAINGGGVALIGSRVHVAGALNKVDLFIDNGAEISNNEASGRGGGLYCGGGNPVPDLGPDGNRHGSIIAVNGFISFNRAAEGAAFYCRGSLEGGGGFQPRPSNGNAVWILGNRSTAASGGCAAGSGTLDATIPAGGDGIRTLGAASNETGMLAITHNNGFNSGLCLVGSYTAGTSTQPANQSRFRIQNVYISTQSGSGVLGVGTAQELELDLRPSGDNVACSFLQPTPCLSLIDNSVDSNGGGFDNGRLLSAGLNSLLNVYRGWIQGNRAGPALFTATSSGVLRLWSSIVDNNEVIANGVVGEGASLFSSSFAANTAVYQSTLIMRTALSRFFRMDDGGFADAHGSILASTVLPAPANGGGNAPADHLLREWCGFFQSTSDFAGHSIISDPTLLSFVVLPAAAFNLDPDTYAPLSPGLIDACSQPSYNRDFYGRPFNVMREPGTPVIADIGAVEAQLQNMVFSNGFE